MGIIDASKRAVPLLIQAARRGDWRVVKSFLGPAYRGLFQQAGKNCHNTELIITHPVHIDWQYQRDWADMAKLYELAKKEQWNASVDIDWSRQVNPLNPATPLLPESFHPASKLPIWNKMPEEQRRQQLKDIMRWFLSQFLHGEQGALYAASQAIGGVPWTEAKMFGASQVLDEARHMEVFHTYINQKLGKHYDINDNLYVVIDAIMHDSRWDIKFLGMQIMVEGLALGAFTMMRRLTGEPLLKDILRYVIKDEARHVKFGVFGLHRFLTTELSSAERKEREDWALAMAVLMRDRFKCHEVYEEHYAHKMKRREWDALMDKSKMMEHFRDSMFQRIIPDLTKIGLLSERVKPHYEKLGLLKFQNEKPATELTTSELLGDEAKDPKNDS